MLLARERWSRENAGNYGDVRCTTVARGEGGRQRIFLSPWVTYDLLFPTRLLTSEDEYKWYWHQMIYFPETINTISTTNTMSPPHSLVSSWAMHTNLLCACWHLEAMRGSSSLTSCRLLILSRLLSSLVWAQLLLLVPTLGIRSPLPQDGATIHRVRAHSLSGIRNTYLAGSHVLKSWPGIRLREREKRWAFL